MSKFVELGILKLIRLYQILFSPWIGQQCRFYPTCSCYAAEAVHEHGPWRGMWLALSRLSRCHPFNPGGIDMVPCETHPWESQKRTTAHDHVQKDG